jgi:hypothetical protein
MENVAVCTGYKVWARSNQYIIRRSPMQDVSTRALHTEVCKKNFVIFFQKFRHGINFTVSILALYNKTQNIKKSSTEDDAIKQTLNIENPNFNPSTPNDL